MNRNAVLKIVNPILGLLFLNQVAVGVLHDMLPYTAFKVLHQGGGIVLTVATAVHVALNWNWVKVNFLRKQPTVKE